MGPKLFWEHFSSFKLAFSSDNSDISITAGESWGECTIQGKQMWEASSPQEPILCWSEALLRCQVRVNNLSLLKEVFFLSMAEEVLKFMITF